MKEHTDQAVYDDEIDLREIFLVLWKRKRIIFFITCLVVIATIIYTSTLPKIYSVYVLMEPGVLDVTSDSKYIYLDSVSNIKARLDSDAYRQRLIKSLNLDPFNDSVNFKVELPGKANIIKVSRDVPEDRIDYGKHLLMQLVKELKADYDVDVLRKKQEYENKISLKENKIQTLNVERKDIEKRISITENFIKGKYGKIGIQKSSLEIVDQRIMDLIQELKDVKGNTQNIIQQRDNILKDSEKKPEYGIADLLYSATIQQNVVFFNTLNNQISDLKIEKENIKADLKTLEKEIDELKLEIERMKIEMTEGIQNEIDGILLEVDQLNTKIDQVQNIRMIDEPLSTTYPIKPNKKLNIILSLFIGLIFSVFIAFIVEYVSNARKTSNEE